MLDRLTIFDIGMHKGNDTSRYLSQGYHVVGIEADPRLVSTARIRFAKYIGAGRSAKIRQVRGRARPSSTRSYSLSVKCKARIPVA